MASNNDVELCKAKNIGEFGRKVMVELCSRNRCVKIQRYFNQEEIDRRADGAEYTRIAMNKDAIERLLSEQIEIEDLLDQLDMGSNLNVDKLDVGWNNYIVFDSNVMVVHLRRYFTLGDELLPSKIGVCLQIREMHRLLSELERLLPKVKES